MILRNDITNEEFETYKKVNNFIVNSEQTLKEARKEGKTVFYRNKITKDEWKQVSKYLFKNTCRLKFDFMKNEFMIEEEQKTNFAVLKFNESSLVGEYADKTIKDIDFDFKLIVFFVDDNNCIPIITGTKSIFQKGKKTGVVNINDARVWKRLTSSEFDKEVLDYSIKLNGNKKCIKN